MYTVAASFRQHMIINQIFRSIHLVFMCIAHR